MKVPKCGKQPSILGKPSSIDIQLFIGWSTGEPQPLFGIGHGEEILLSRMPMESRIIAILGLGGPEDTLAPTSECAVSCQCYDVFLASNM